MDFNKALRLISDKLVHWAQDLVRMIPNILLAAVVLVVGIFLAKLVKRIASKLLHRALRNVTLGDLFTSIVYFAFIGIVVFTVLTILNLSGAVTSILAGAGLLGLALAFAFQDMAANLISGIFISFRKPFRLKHVVMLGSYMGKVEEINLRDTVIRTFQGQLVIIPNKDVFQNPIENFTLLGKRRLDLTIGVSYGDDLDRVKTVTMEAVRDIPHLSDEDETSMYYKEFGESSVNFVLRLWVKSPEQKAFLEVNHEAIIRIKKAYDANDILLPFPIRTLDFGIKGGVSMREQLRKAENSSGS